VDRVARLAEDLPRPSPRAGQQGAEPPTADEPTLSWSSASTDANIELPILFGDYELRDKIGQGGMGIVFRAYKISLAVEVALKMIRADKFGSPEEMRYVLKEEARAQAPLDHPHIVPVKDFGEVAGQPYFTMKLVEGSDMNKQLPRLAKDLKGTVHLLAKVARAVHYAHERGVLHRDLKPGNILLEGKPDTPVAHLVPLVSDFGLAMRIQPDTPDSRVPTADEAGYVAPEQALRGGTPGFMPPEQAALETKPLTTAVDVYSLGAILYKVLTGRPPFLGPTTTETLSLVRTHTPEPPRNLKPGVNRDLEAVCLKCLEKQPERRYRSALELAEELERWGRNEPVLARRRPWPTRAWRAARRNMLLCTVMILAGFAAGAGFVAHYWLDPDRPRKQDAAKLTSKHAVTLIDENGPPRYNRLVPSNDVIIASSSPKLPFSFETLNVGRLELMSAVPVQAYRFSAKIRHDYVINETVDGAAGIYFAYSVQGNESYWCELTFAELGINSRKPNFARGATRDTGQVLLRVYHRTYELDSESDNYRKAIITKVSKRFSPQPFTWRSLSVEVRPESVKAFWGEGEDAPIGEITSSDLLEAAKTFRMTDSQTPEPLYEYAPQGGLGLFLSSGSASFQQVIVEPLQ
jgi:serine/threonine protein kinase